MVKKPFSRFEIFAKQLVEGSLSRLLGGRFEMQEVITQLALALEDSQLDGVAANHFIIRLHPADFEQVEAEKQNQIDRLIAHLIQVAYQNNLKLEGQPQIDLQRDEAVAPGHVRITAKHQSGSASPTTQIFPSSRRDGTLLATLHALDAVLIIRGRRHVPLNEPFITLGRRMDNDIVIDASTVSRQHAQIRWRLGYFVLYDVGGRERTFVNGETVSEHVLQAGDVIGLGDVLIVYAEGQESRPPKLVLDDEDEETLAR